MWHDSFMVEHSKPEVLGHCGRVVVGEIFPCSIFMSKKSQMTLTAMHQPGVMEMRQAVRYRIGRI